MRPYRALPLLLLALPAACAAAEAPPARPTIYPALARRAALLEASGVAGAPVATEDLYRGPSQNSVLVRVEGPIPLHIHRGSEETVYMLDGAGRLHLVGAEPVAVKSGDFVVVPRGVPHGFTPDEGPAPLVLSMFSPPLGEGDRIPVDAEGRPLDEGTLR